MRFWKNENTTEVQVRFRRKGGNKQGKTKKNRNLNQHVNDLEMPII